MAEVRVEQRQCRRLRPSSVIAIVSLAVLRFYCCSTATSAQAFAQGGGVASTISFTPSSPNLRQRFIYTHRPMSFESRRFLSLSSSPLRNSHRDHFTTHAVSETDTNNDDITSDTTKEVVVASRKQQYKNLPQPKISTATSATYNSDNRRRMLSLSITATSLLLFSSINSIAAAAATTASTKNVNSADISNLASGSSNTNTNYSGGVYDNNSRGIKGMPVPSKKLGGLSNKIRSVSRIMVSSNVENNHSDVVHIFFSSFRFSYQQIMSLSLSYH